MRQDGFSLVEVLVAIAVAAIALAAAANAFFVAGASLITADVRSRQMAAAVQAADSARGTGWVPSMIYEFRVQVTSREADYGGDAHVAWRVPNHSCQGDCAPSVWRTVEGSLIHAVDVFGQTPVRVVVIQTR
jgi:prepilin-type N-terminal cleavage/methylation domain-containing protein